MAFIRPREKVPVTAGFPGRTAAVMRGASLEDMRLRCRRWGSWWLLPEVLKRAPPNMC